MGQHMLVSNPNEFDLIRIGLASPERIRFWSHGEVQKPETINYRTFRPERKGLFCEKIFGPVKDWECACGKYRRVRYRGIVCERCGVEVTHSKVRRERMGHIELATPVAHIWFLKGVPSYIGLVLDLPYKTLEKVIYYDSYIVTEVADGISSEVQPKQILSEGEYLELKEKFGNQFKAEMGAKAIRDLLQQIDLHTLIKSLRHEIKTNTGHTSQAYLKAVKRLRAAEGLLTSGNKAEWMVMECIPVMPPDLRPMVQLEGGRFATSDLNDLYRRVVNRNNRLKRLLDIGAPNMIIRNEKRMLQEAVDVLIDNGRRGRPVTGSNGRPLRSLSDIIEGKQGRFRQNLLGKRVDYSGRSVIVVGPHLKLHQCGLPKEMAIELFKPFIIRKLVEKGHVQNVKSAKRKIESKDVVVYDVLDEVIKGHPVMLNRAPTLHRLGIQAFEPILVEGKAIQIHPLVCTAFNADFDGDQMAVHVPLSIEAQTEARLLMLSANNLLSPSNGAPIITPTQDMVIGLYYLTITTDDKRPGDGKVFSTDNEALLAYELGIVDLHAKIKIRKGNERIETTIGRLIFNSKVNQVVEHFRRQKLEFINKTIGKKQLSVIILEWHRTYGSTITAELCDKLKDLGYTYATKAGVSIAIDDLTVPEEKKGILTRAEKDVDKIEELSRNGALSSREMKERSQEIWRTATAEITQAMIRKFTPMNNVNMMATSGARGNIDQVRQLAGMRGLMADASGNTVDIPIKSNFREGLNMTEYFISSYGARKGIVDTALRTADSGYLTRRLVDVVQDVMITEEDCGTTDYVEISAIKDGYETMVSLEERLTGKYSMEKIVDAATGEQLVDKGEEITYDIARKIQAAGIETVKIRTVLVCRTKKGICQKCYGRDLSRDRAINIGEAVGIISAQSIGEPGTQLTMRTFHTGGVDLSKATRVEIKASHDGKIEMEDGLKLRKVKDDLGNDIVVAVREGKVFLKRHKGNDITFNIPAGAEMMVKNNSSVSAGDVIAGHNPSYEYVITGTEGKVQFIGFEVKETKSERIALRDGEVFVYNPKVKREYVIPAGKEVMVKDGVRVKAEDELASGIVAETAGIILKIEVSGADTVIVVAPGEAYPILAGARVMIADGSTVDADDILARESAAGINRAARDIVAGLPRVEELFEGRRPKNYALLSDIDGIAEVNEKEGVRTITISDGSMKKEYKVPYGVRLKVFPGKKVEKGDYLTDGIKDPHDVLRINGVKAAQVYLSEEVQKVYRSQGVRINEKHIETIARQMTNKVRITGMGDTDFLIGDLVDVFSFEEVNKEMKEKGKEEATADRVLLGITKASLNTESVFSAASFQETTSVLTSAAIKGKSDPMYGLKENVIIGKIIPAGTGLPIYRNIKLTSTEGTDLDETIEKKEEVLATEEA